MLESRKVVLKQSALFFVGELLGAAVMFGVYALLQRLNFSVVLGGTLGVIIAALNFFFMALYATIAADKAINQDVAGGQRVMRISQLVRYVLMFGALVVIGVSKKCDLIATVIPLLLFRPIVSVIAFFGKSGESI